MTQQELIYSTSPAQAPLFAVTESPAAKVYDTNPVDLVVYTIAPQNTTAPHGLNTFQVPELYTHVQHMVTAQLQESNKLN